MTNIEWTTIVESAYLTGVSRDISMVILPIVMRSELMVGNRQMESRDWRY